MEQFFSTSLEIQLYIMNIIIIYSWIYNWAFLCVLLIYLTYHVSTNGTFCLFAFLSQSYHVTLPGLGTHRASPASASKVLEWKVCTPMPDSAQCVSYCGFIEVHVIWQKIVNFLGYLTIFGPLGFYTNLRINLSVWIKK